MLDKHAFFPFFQPLINTSTGTIAGYEALARRRCPETGKVVSAGPLFSDPSIAPGELLEIDRHVRRRALQRLARDEAMGFLTINISPLWINQLGKQATTPTLELIRELDIDPQRVVIEITEDVGSLDILRHCVRVYREAGLRIAIDDFGAGGSQLDRVIALEPDMLKFDMRWFKQAVQGGVAMESMLATAQAAERLGMVVVFEGVETEQEFCFGLECGAHYMQGFLFHPAVPDVLLQASTEPLFDRLSRDYVARKLAQKQHEITESLLLKDMVRKIRNHWIENRLQELPAQLDGANRCLRFYVCDFAGVQLSPNYMVFGNTLVADDSVVGLKRYWRPYFIELVALRELKPQGLFSSHSYRDVNSGMLCKTYAVSLPSDRLLLIDYQENERLAWLDRTFSPPQPAAGSAQVRLLDQRVG